MNERSRKVLEQSLLIGVYGYNTASAERLLYHKQTNIFIDSLCNTSSYKNNFNIKVNFIRVFYCYFNNLLRPISFK